MRWFKIRKARIDDRLRETFERYGTGTMQAILAGPKWFHHDGQQRTVQDYLFDLLAWLTEEYDKAERKQTWSITMEVFITGFVGTELLIELLRLIGRAN
jgi:hypothetical protein